MRRIAGTGALALLATVAAGGTANAAAYDCTRPSEPRIPSGHTLQPHEVDGLARDAERYQAAMESYLDCLRQEADHAVREFETVVRTYRQTLEEFRRQ